MMMKVHYRTLVSIAAAIFALKLVLNLRGGYGYFIDELYYLACARRLDFGYVDHPPLAPFLLRVHTELFGSSLVAVRTLSALVGAATIVLAGWVAAFVGGGRYAQALTGLGVALAPLYLLVFDMFSMNGLEILFWTASFAVVLVMVQRNDPRLWLLYGAIAGLGLLNKHTMVLAGVATLVGLLLSPSRKLLWSPWLVGGGLVALVLFLPNLLWQAANGWPSLEFYRNASLLKNLPSPPLKTLGDQVLTMNPVTLPLWVAGLWVLWREPKWRAIAYAYAVLLVLLVVSQQSRPDRLGGIYPVVFAAGAVFWERQTKALRYGFMALLVLGCLALAPMFLPILPPVQAAEFVAAIGVDTQMEQGAGKRAELPQWLADRFGWEELVAQVADVYEALPPEERERAIIGAPSYGQAGAIERFGPRYGLPPVIAGHNTYHAWSRELAPRLADSVVIAVGWNPEDLSQSFGDVRQVAIYTCEYCMGWRNDMPIYVARKPKLSASEFEEAWELVKHYE